MQKFSQFVNDHKATLEESKKAELKTEFDSLCEAKLKEMGAKSPMDLSEEDLEKFNEYVKTIKEELSKRSSKKVTEKDAEKPATKVTEKEVSSEKEFREYAENLLKTAHGDDYDEKIGKKVIDDLVAKVDGDNWGEAVGRLTSGLGK